jgi:hypothetical protein
LESRDSRDAILDEKRWGVFMAVSLDAAVVI